MPGKEVQYESQGQREGKGESRAVLLFRASQVYSTYLFVIPLDCPVFTPGPKPWSPASSPALNPLWPHNYCSHAYYESAKWELEQGLKNTVLEKLLK